MKKRHKALKVRIYPTIHQKTLIDKTLGSLRWGIKKTGE
ncbi:MAG: helix-turn-helix domain-containing protein [Sphaerochaeta sp.]|nr:helix-turn-helix domain-containing protein [Sphaerochaeta sp.]